MERKEKVNEIKDYIDILQRKNVDIETLDLWVEEAYQGIEDKENIEEYMAEANRIMRKYAIEEDFEEEEPEEREEIEVSFETDTSEALSGEDEAQEEKKAELRESIAKYEKLYARYYEKQQNLGEEDQIRYYALKAKFAKLRCRYDRLQLKNLEEEKEAGNKAGEALKGDYQLLVEHYNELVGEFNEISEQYCFLKDKYRKLERRADDDVRSYVFMTLYQRYFESIRQAEGMEYDEILEEEDPDTPEEGVEQPDIMEEERAEEEPVVSVSSETPEQPAESGSGEEESEAPAESSEQPAAVGPMEYLEDGKEAFGAAEASEPGQALEGAMEVSSPEKVKESPETVETVEAAQAVENTVRIEETPLQAPFQEEAVQKEDVSVTPVENGTEESQESRVERINRNIDNAIERVNAMNQAPYEMPAGRTETAAVPVSENLPEHIVEYVEDKKEEKPASEPEKRNSYAPSIGAVPPAAFNGNAGPVFGTTVYSWEAEPEAYAVEPEAPAVSESTYETGPMKSEGDVNPQPAAGGSQAGYGETPGKPVQEVVANPSAYAEAPGKPIPEAVVNPSVYGEAPAKPIPEAVANPSAYGETPAKPIPEVVANPSAYGETPIKPIPEAVANPSAYGEAQVKPIPEAVANPSAYGETPVKLISEAVANPSAYREVPVKPVQEVVANPSAYTEAPVKPIPEAVMNPSAYGETPIKPIPEAMANPSAYAEASVKPIPEAVANPSAYGETPIKPIPEAVANPSTYGEVPGKPIPEAVAQPLTYGEPQVNPVPEAATQPSAYVEPPVKPVPEVMSYSSAYGELPVENRGGSSQPTEVQPLPYEEPELQIAYEDLDSVDLIDGCFWCMKNGHEREALERLVAQMPSYYVESGILYYCENEEEKHRLVEQLQLEYKNTPAAEKYKFDNINDYIMKYRSVNLGENSIKIRIADTRQPINGYSNVRESEDVSLFLELRKNIQLYDELCSLQSEFHSPGADAVGQMVKTRDEKVMHYLKHIRDLKNRLEEKEILTIDAEEVYYTRGRIESYNPEKGFGKVVSINGEKAHFMSSKIKDDPDMYREGVDVIYKTGKNENGYFVIEISIAK